MCSVDTTMAPRYMTVAWALACFALISGGLAKNTKAPQITRNPELVSLCYGDAAHTAAHSRAQAGCVIALMASQRRQWFMRAI